MHFVTFIMVFVFVLAAAILFSLGLVKLYHKNNGQARGLISTPSFFVFRMLSST